MGEKGNLPAESGDMIKGDGGGRGNVPGGEFGAKASDASAVKGLEVSAPKTADASAAKALDVSVPGASHPTGDPVPGAGGGFGGGFLGGGRGRDDDPPATGR